MSLLDRIEQDNSAQATAELQHMSAAEEERAAIDKIRRDIITVKIKEFAETLGVESVELSAKSGVRYFVVGGIVISIRLHGNVDKAKLTTTKPSDVLWQYRTFLVGANPIDDLREITLGTLSLINYGDIRKVVNNHCDLTFKYDVIVTLLYPQDTTA